MIMSAFIISQVEARDAQALAAYRRLAERSIASFDGRYLVRGGKQSVLEGDWTGQTVIVEFPSLERARAWYDSPDYASARALAPKALTRNLLLIEGVAPLRSESGA